MTVKTYDEILTELCDTFDGFIRPKKVTRSNTNIIYLILKAFAKGLEVVNNLVVNLSNKFEPAFCSEEDLDSVGRLVGTERLSGSATGLQINILNTSEVPVTLYAGNYTYEYDSDTIFTMVVLKDVQIAAGDTVSYIAMSNVIAAVPVTAQDSIALKDSQGLSIDIAFKASCDDNAGLLGTSPESTVDFRERVVQGVSTASLLHKMETEIRNLPYIFDCRLYFNNTADTVVKGGVAVPAWHLLVNVSGMPDEKVAEIVLKYSIFPTVVTDKYIPYKDSIIEDGEYKVYYRDFDFYRYSLRILYSADEMTVSDTTVLEKFDEALVKYRNTNIYTETLTEQMFANILENTGISSLKVLNVDILDVATGDYVDYINVPVTHIARLENIAISRRAA